MTPTEGRSFGQEHFGAACLGDRRRTRSLVDLADRCARHPGGTLPQKFHDPNALRRCYDLMRCPAVTHDRVLAPHVQRTLERARAQPGVLLALHDGSELDFSSLASLRDQLGQVGNGSGRGYQCLNSLLVVPAGKQVLGLASQILYARPEVPKDETRAQKRQREDRESLLWLRAVDQIEAAQRACRRRRGPGVPPAPPRVVDVVDRGGDTFEFLEHEARLGRWYVVRSQHNRAIQVGHDGTGPPARLHDHLRTQPEQGRRAIELSDRPGRPARRAEVAVAWAAVAVQAPDNPRGRHGDAPLAVWALRVWEPEPPAGAEAVEWFLLTPVAVAALARAWEVVDWYCLRWVVEEFHKAQKTGCAIEAPQFTKAERLQPMIALLSVVATALLQLRSDGRDPAGQQEPAAALVPEEYVGVLSGWRYGQRRPLTRGEFFQALARLGGHQNRRGDGPPGWLVLWRGWTALQTMVAGARAARCPEGRPPTPAGSRPSSRPPPQ
jgi:Transposase DNA-binding